ncbi:hypothetical protein NKJ28_14250 [Mesorhizobium sp. M0145]|uniref:hypothetical protein n=1 Tax=Mesorhizobium sp. M0145 TaxID=2956895 RepID=UPI00333BA4A8
MVTSRRSTARKADRQDSRQQPTADLLAKADAEPKDDPTNLKRKAAGRGVTARLPQIPKPAEILRQGAASVLADVRRNLTTLAGEHRKSLYHEVTTAYAVGMVLRADQDEWLTFCLHSDWGTFRNRPKDSDRSDALRHAIRFAVGFGVTEEAKKAKNRRVDRLHGALKSFFADNVPPADIPAKIREGRGLEKLKSANATKAGISNPPKQEYLTFRVPLDAANRRLLERQLRFTVHLKLHVEKRSKTRFDAQLLDLKTVDRLPIGPCYTPFAPQKPSKRSKPANDDDTQLRIPTTIPKRNESTGHRRKVVTPR